MKRVFASVLVALELVGCISENIGSSTMVGEEFSLPEISDRADSVSVKIFQSIKGAKIWTEKDSKVNVEYDNTYTNTYFGVFEFIDSMRLKVKVEPLDCSEPAISDGSK